MSRGIGDELCRQVGRMYRFAWNMLGNAADAERATEETLSLAERFIGRDGDRVSLYATAFDVLLQAGQRERRATRPDDALLPRFDSQGRLVPAPVDWSEEALREALGTPDHLEETLRGLLQRLDPVDRAAFVLREIEQIPPGEIVCILRLPVEEVRARVHRATLRLQGMLTARTRP